MKHKIAILFLFSLVSCKTPKNEIINQIEKTSVSSDFLAKKNSFDLFLLLSAYHHYYLEYPPTIEDLVVFDSLSNTGLKSNRFRNTVDFLRNNNEKIGWITTDYDITVLFDNDTLIYYPAGDSQSICYSQCQSEKLLFRFFDSNNYYAYSEDIEKKFKYGIKALASNYSLIEEKEFDIIIMVYDTKEGLRPFCNNSFPMNSMWFTTLEEYVEAFSKEYGLGKIVFSVVDLKVE